MQEVFAVPDTPQFSHDIPIMFSSIADARDGFELLNRKCVNHYRIIMQAIPATEASEMSQYLLRQYEACFDRWCNAFSRFEESRGDSLTTKERIGLKLLSMHKQNTMMYLEYVNVCEMERYSDITPSFSWDKFNPQFAEIVSLAASIVNTHDAGSLLATSARPSFSLDNGIIAPLYEVATLCRDPVIRRRAVQILRSAPRQEGVFNSHLSAIVAEKIIEIEEAAALKAISDYSDFPLEYALSGQELEKNVNNITDSTQIPDGVRLTYAHPKFNVAEKKVFLTVGQTAKTHMKMHIDIPWSNMNFLVDAET